MKRPLDGTGERVGHRGWLAHSKGVNAGNPRELDLSVSSWERICLKERSGGGRDGSVYGLTWERPRFLACTMRGGEGKNDEAHTRKQSDLAT